MDISSLTPDKQVKLQYWLEVIRQCRASGLTNQAWCEQHNISLKSYYYWIAKIRKLALEDLPRKNNGIHATADQYTLLQKFLFLVDTLPVRILQWYSISEP